MSTYILVFKHRILYYVYTCWNWVHPMTVTVINIIGFLYAYLPPTVAVPTYGQLLFSSHLHNVYAHTIPQHCLFFINFMLFYMLVTCYSSHTRQQLNYVP